MTDELAVTTQLPNTGDYAFMERGSTDETLVHLWLNSERRKHSRLTQEQYLRTWRAFSAYVAKPLQAVTLSDLEAWQESLGGTPATRKVKTAAVRSLFSFAAKLGYLRANVALMLAPGKVADTKHRKALDEQDVLRLLVACRTHREKALVHVLYSSGARVSELLALTWQDVTPRTQGGAVLHILHGKGDKQREAGISAGAYSALLTLRDEGTQATAPVFSTRTGKALDRQAAHRLLKEIAERAGVTSAFSAHWLRHSFVTHALKHGAAPQDVQAQAGHSSLAVTTSYAHADSFASDVLVL